MKSLKIARFIKKQNILIIFYIHDDSLHVAERKIGFIGITIKNEDKQLIKLTGS